MDLLDLVVISLVVLLIMVLALFSAAEAALRAVSRSRLQTLEQDGNKRAGVVNRLLATPDRVTGAALVGSCITSILATALATGLFAEQLGWAGVLYAAILMALVISLCGVLLPAAYARRHPERVALGTAPMMRAATIVLSPIGRSQNQTNGSRAEQANGLAPQDDFRGAIDQQPAGDAQMIGGVLDLLNLQVLDVMVHRTKMRTVNVSTPTEKLVDEVLKSPFTRLPVWEEEPENIIGVIHAKDLLVALGRVGWDQSKLDIRDLLTEPWFVPDTTPLKAQLNAFLKRKTHFALVVDEYGEVQGLITMEDILEEIVGQISDEHDLQDAAIRPQADGTVNVDGSVPIRDLNRQMGWNLPDGEATTIAGLVIHEAETIPEPGQAFTFYGFRFEILRKSRNRITALRVKPIPVSVSASSPTAATPPRVG